MDMHKSKEWNRLKINLKELLELLEIKEEVKSTWRMTWDVDERSKQLKLSDFELLRKSISKDMIAISKKTKE